MGVKTVGQIDCVKLPEIVVSHVGSTPEQKQVQNGAHKLPHQREGSLKGAWDMSKSCDLKRKSNQSTSLRHSGEGDLHHNTMEENPPLERSKKNPLKVKRRHSERYQSYEMKSRGSIESTPATNGICRSKSFAHRKQTDHLKCIHDKPVFHASRSDTFFLSDLLSHNNVDKGKTEVRKKSNKLGDTKALIDKYINSSVEESLSPYQSDLSFLYRNRAGETGLNLKRSLLWNKTKDKTPEELNMLDLGNSYTKKKRGSDITMGILQERNTPLSPRRASFDVADMHRGKTPGGSTGKRVIFNEDSTKIMDVVEVEPTLEFAGRLGRRDSEGGSRNVHDQESFSSTPISRSSSLKPILKNSGINHLQQGDTSSISWSEYYQDSSDSESDSDYGLSSRQPLKLPNLGWPTSSRSMVSSPSYVSPRFGPERSASLPLRSRTEIPIRSISPRKKFQCSKEFAHVLKNLDSDDEDLM